MQIKTAANLRDFVQPFFVKLRFYNLSRGIFHERRSAIVAVDWNERALRRAHPNRENSHARISRGLGCLRRITVQLFAIGENDQRSISGGAFSKCVYGELRKQSWRNKLAKFRNSPLLGARKQHGQNRDREQCPKPDRRAETHKIDISFTAISSKWFATIKVERRADRSRSSGRVETNRGTPDIFSRPRSIFPSCRCRCKSARAIWCRSRGRIAHRRFAQLVSSRPR